MSRLLEWGSHQTRAIIVKDGDVETLWDSRIKNLVYNTTSMEWEAQSSSSGGGGGGDASAANQTLHNTKLDTLIAKDYATQTTLAAMLAELQTGVALASRVDEASATITYVGKAARGALNASAAWQINRISTSGAVITIEFADGNGAFDNIWNNRAILSYS